MKVEQDEISEPFTTLTVNVNPFLQSETDAFVDTNNNPWAERFIRENRLGKPTGDVSFNGYCSYPLYAFDTARFCRGAA